MGPWVGCQLKFVNILWIYYLAQEYLASVNYKSGRGMQKLNRGKEGVNLNIYIKVNFPL